MEIGCVDEIIDIAIRIWNAWIFRRKSPLSINDEFIPTS